MEEILEDLENAIQQEIAKHGTGLETCGGPLDNLIAAKNFAGEEYWDEVQYHLQEAGDSGSKVLEKHKNFIDAAPKKA
jgi:hypothetical protein